MCVCFFLLLSSVFCFCFWFAAVINVARLAFSWKRWKLQQMNLAWDSLETILLPQTRSDETNEQVTRYHSCTRLSNSIPSSNQYRKEKTKITHLRFLIMMLFWLCLCVCVQSIVHRSVYNISRPSYQLHQSLLSFLFHCCNITSCDDCSWLLWKFHFSIVKWRIFLECCFLPFFHLSLVFSVAFVFHNWNAGLIK